MALINIVLQWVLNPQNKQVTELVPPFRGLVMTDRWQNEFSVDPEWQATEWVTELSHGTSSVSICHEWQATEQVPRCHVHVLLGRTRVPCCVCPNGDAFSTELVPQLCYQCCSHMAHILTYASPFWLNSSRFSGQLLFQPYSWEEHCWTLNMVILA